MPSISVVIPTLRVGDLLDKCIASIDGYYDELIVVDDKIDNLAKKINKGMGKATKDYIVVSNDDVILSKGSLDDLCKEGKVVSPKIQGGTPKVFHHHMYCIPRDVYKEIGPYHEGYKRFYFDDSDYWMKLLKAGYEPELSDEVMIIHDHPASTIKTLGRDEEGFKNNRELFIERWGEESLRIVL